MRLRAGLLAGALLLLATAGAISPRAEEPTVAPPIYNVFSDEDEKVLGKQAADETINTVPMLSDAIVEAYVNDVGQRIVAKSRRTDVKYQFRVINSNKVNAFALPAGYVFVERGLLHYVDTEYELVGALAHEVGHVVGRHGLANVSRITLLKLAIEQAKKLGVLDPNTIQSIFDQYGGVAFLFVNNKFSRDQESEADLFGCYNAVRSGWDPNGAVIVFNKFAQERKEQDLMHQLLSTHPDPAERAKAVSTEIKKMQLPPNLTTNSLAFRGMKARLSMLGAPPPDPRDKKKP
jgi:predicted Zn-dependent protease